ncbi:MAG: hypothetical protein LBS46_05580 [Dysgonamonadaceae bacterium]|jgi:hypothetical protein|nr:hypothetical protein [Dysgonamonadaceae bacterium]
MKKTINLFAIFAILFFCGCENEDYPRFEDSQVKIEQSNVTFTAKGGTGSIIVGTSDYTASVDQNWCKLSTSGNTITVTVEPNISVIIRSANVTIQSGDKINFVPVTQNAVYLHLENYETISLLGRGGTISFPYECETSVSVTSDVSWITPKVEGDQIVLQAMQNPNFLESRKATLTLTAGDNLFSLKLNVEQKELITSYEPDPDMDAVNNFLNLKNNNGTSSRYKVTYFSSRLASLYNTLITAYPILQEMRIEAPRSSYKLSVILYNTIGNQYWNATNGLVPIDGSKTVAAFALSGDSYSGTSPAYTSNTNYTQLRACFASSKGFTIIQEDNVFWFRSVDNPLDYFKAEPASW